jgi:uncharacterized protein YcfJ
MAGKRLKAVSSTTRHQFRAHRPIKWRLVICSYIRNTFSVTLCVELRVVKLIAIIQAFHSEYQMEMNQTSKRIHPLMAGAAVSVMLVSLLGIAAITGVLPNSHGTTAAETARTTALAPVIAPVSAPAQQVATNPAVRNEGADHNTVVHHHPVKHAQAETGQQSSQAPASRQPAPVARNSPIGIGVGAVVGGLLGNQVGGGNGKTLATIAGAVGGGYVGNEVAKRNP